MVGENKIAKNNSATMGNPIVAEYTTIIRLVHGTKRPLPLVTHPTTNNSVGWELGDNFDAGISYDDLILEPNTI